MAYKNSFLAGIDKIKRNISAPIQTAEQLLDFVHTQFHQDFRSVDELLQWAHTQLPNEKLSTITDLIDYANKKITGYTRVRSIDELKTISNLHMHDLSELDLRDWGDMFTSEMTGPFTYAGINSWTDRVIWPSHDKMPKGFAPQQILENAKQSPGITELHKKNIDGRGINIAIMDGRLNRTHPEYADRIKYYSERTKENKNPNPESHGSLVAGCAVGKNTGTAPGATLYYFESESNGHFIDRYGRQLKKLLDLQKSLPESDKIRILSCSWAPTRRDSNTPKETEKILSLFKQLEDSGILVIYCNSSAGNIVPCDLRTKIGDTRLHPGGDPRIGIPTNEHTTPYYKGGYQYSRMGGDSSSVPYLAGVFACALQGNTIFCTRENWQDELIEIMKQTALPHEHGGKLINPTGIRNHVTEIAREMEMNLLKIKSTQHE